MPYIMKFAITLTWSKAVALIVLIGAIFLGATSFMFSLPFVVVLITGKQYIDKTKTDEKH